jgi:hypothetical protein
MNNIIDLERARRRRLVKRVGFPPRQWWRLWFWPLAMPPEGRRRLLPEELRRGGVWGPSVDRGRQSGADLSLIYPH